jgi:hypothetical protein
MAILHQLSRPKREPTILAKSGGGNVTSILKITF